MLDGPACHLRSRRAIVASAIALLSACQLAPTFERGDASLPRHAYGRVGEGGVPPTGATYTPRLGPGTNPWSDVWAGGPAPAALGSTRPALTGLTTSGPDIVIDGRAVWNDGTSLVAMNLETGAEIWRLSDARRLQSGLMTTDGETLCGIAVLAPGSSNAIVACLSMSDGRELFRDDTGTFLSTSGETVRLTDLEITGDVLYARAYDELIAYDIPSGSRLFTERTQRHWRGFVRVGDDLLTMIYGPCDTGAGACILALDPRTGAVRASRSIPGAVVYLLSSGGEAIFVNHFSYFLGFEIAYDPVADTFRDAPEWSWADGLAGISEVLEGGTAFAWDGANLVEIDLASRGRVQAFSAREGPLRVHPNVVFSTSAGGGIQGRPRSGATLGEAAFHYESWSFTGGAWHDLP